MPFGGKITFTKGSYMVKGHASINSDINEKVADGAMNGTGKNDGTQQGNSPAGGSGQKSY